MENTLRSRHRVRRGVRLARCELDSCIVASSAKAALAPACRERRTMDRPNARADLKRSFAYGRVQSSWDLFRLGDLKQRFVIGGRPRLSRFLCGAFGFAYSHHLFCLLPRQAASARQSPTPADRGKILAHFLCKGCHSCFSLGIISGLRSGRRERNKITPHMLRCSCATARRRAFEKSICLACWLSAKKRDDLPAFRL
jgi:hypothetical protein